MRLNDFSSIFSGVVESAADEIAEKSSDPQVRQRALLWKTYAIPALYRSVFLSDPLAALIDTWILCIQMREYFEVGAGKNSFGEYQFVAAESSRRLENDVLEIVKKSTVEKELPKASVLIYSWAKDNPVENHYFVRSATSELYAESLMGGERNIRTVFGSILQGVEDISSELNAYSEILPKIARWQAEYFLDQALTDERIALMVERSRQEIDSLLVRTFEGVDLQRIETLNALEQQRLALTADLQFERNIILEEIERERIETLNQVRELTDEAINKTSVNMTELIDHAFMKVIQILVVLLIIGMILIYFARKMKAH